MEEALKEIWKTKFEKALKREYDIRDMDKEREAELLNMKIDICLDMGDKEGFEVYSKQLKSLEFFINLS